MSGTPEKLNEFANILQNEGGAPPPGPVTPRRRRRQGQTPGRENRLPSWSPPDLGALVQESSLSSDSLGNLHMTSRASRLQNQVTKPADPASFSPLGGQKSLLQQADQAAFPFLEATVREMHFNLHVFAKKIK